MSIVSCSVGECESAIYVKKRMLCKYHYNRLLSAGTTDRPSAPTTCLHCGGPNLGARATGPSPSYCSTKCRRDAAYVRTVRSGRYAATLAARQAEAAARPPVLIGCSWCSEMFERGRVDAIFCSTSCNRKHLDANNPKRCTEVDCERGVRAKGLCSMHWRRLARAEGRESNPVWDDNRRAHYHKRRAQKFSTQVEDLRPIDIYERDIWLCGLCSTPVDPDVCYPDPMSPSLDHVVPLSLGGAHTYENVQLAHLTCNVSKGNRVAA
jgi:5-methylcytosine-specific restriction endonuclease McrA